VCPDVQAAAVRHVDVKQQQIPAAFAQLVQRLFAGGRLTHLANRSIFLQQLHQS
jgi:hypothetical protein